MKLQGSLFKVICNFVPVADAKRLDAKVCFSFSF